MSARAGAFAVAAVLAARPLAAQVPRYLGVDLGLARPHFEATSAVGTERLSGVVAHGRLRLVLRPVSIDVSYGQGRLAADSGTAAARTFVEGSAFFAAHATSWLSIKAGPHVRAYATPGGTERWVLWEAHAHADISLVEGQVAAYAEGWLAVGSSVNLDPGASGAHGAEAGITAKLPNSPLWARLGFVTDKAQLKGGARTEVLQSVVLSVGFGGR